MKLNDSWIEASYAPSNRATCKGCHLKISMKDLRLSTCSDAMEMVYQNHFHYDCFILQKKFKDIELKDIFHIQSLEKVDQEKVQKKIEQLKLGFGKQKIKVKSSQKETKKAQESDEELDEAKMEQKMSAMLLEENPNKQNSNQSHQLKRLKLEMKHLIKVPIYQVVRVREKMIKLPNQTVIQLQKRNNILNSEINAKKRLFLS